MILINRNLLKSSTDNKKICLLLDQAELAINTWQNIWSSFQPAPIREELLNLLKPINDLRCFSSGGFAGAERHRICFSRNFDSNPPNDQSIPILGINIEGNFLFDKPKTKDFRLLLEDLGAEPGDLGDIWIKGDRGAQVICSEETAHYLNGKESSIREVKINCKKLDLDKLQIPVQRAQKKIKTVEASTRIDAIASAGFGLSRAKIVNKIKDGQLLLNWQPVSNASKSVKKGDRIKLETKGSIEIINLEETKKSRWRVELMRN